MGEYHVIAPYGCFSFGLSLSFAKRGVAPRFGGRGSLRCGVLGREIRGVVTRGGEGPPGEGRGGYVFSTNSLHNFTPYKCIQHLIRLYKSAIDIFIIVYKQFVHPVAHCAHLKVYLYSGTLCRL